MPELVPGDLAPSFNLETSDGGTVSLSDYSGRRVVVYFYPAAMTSGCTTEACDFRDSLSDLAEAGVAVVGISPDPVSKLADFAARESLTFPLASDPTRETIERWGVLGEKIKDGVKVVAVIRSTFVVAADGRFELVLRGVSPEGHVAQLRQELGVD